MNLRKREIQREGKYALFIKITYVRKHGKKEQRNQRDKSYPRNYN